MPSLRARRAGLAQTAAGRRPRLPDDARLVLPPAGVDCGLHASFLGNSSVLFDDGETQLVVDGFFTRPAMMRSLLGTVAPDVGVIDRCLSRAGITRLAAVVVLHTHYDHVLDSAVVAARTGAVLIGSTSALMVGRGADLPEDRLFAPAPDESVALGRFRIRFVASAHVPPPRLSGDITAPVRPPARVRAYRMGVCQSLLLEHAGRSILVQGSAGFVPGALSGRAAETVYLAVGTLGRLPQSYRERYWSEVVVAVGARRVLLTHWDDFWRPLSRPLVPMPYLVDDLNRTLDALRRLAAATDVDVRLPTLWQPTDPFRAPADRG